MAGLVPAIHVLFKCMGEARRLDLFHDQSTQRPPLTRSGHVDPAGPLCRVQAAWAIEVGFPLLHLHGRYR
jgi:hypothetical protein